MAFVGNSHLVAGTGDMISWVLARLAEEGIETEGNPDLYVRSFSHFGIDEARELRERAVLTAASSRRIFVIQSASLTTEAQNALLKTFEEPPGNALFILIVASPDMLLSTLRSRMQTLRIDATVSASALQMHATVNRLTVATYPDPKAFLRATPAARLEMLKTLLDKGEDERRDMGSILTFLSSLEGILDRGDATALNAVYRAKKYAGDKGALVKPLLEQLALLAPVIS